MGNVKCVGSEKAKARLCPRHDATTERLSEFYLNGSLQQLRGLLAEMDMFDEGSEYRKWNVILKRIIERRFNGSMKILCKWMFANFKHKGRMGL